MKIRLTPKQLELLTEFCIDYYVAIRLDYSGRGMYGYQCLGFVFDSETNEYKVLMELTEYLLDNEEDILLNCLKKRICSDSMGIGSIVYFPNVQEPEQNDEKQEPNFEPKPSEYADQHNP
jgi:hypothetical protein